MHRFARLATSFLSRRPRHTLFLQRQDLFSHSFSTSFSPSSSYSPNPSLDFNSRILLSSRSLSSDFPHPQQHCQRFFARYDRVLPDVVGQYSADDDDRSLREDSDSDSDSFSAAVVSGIWLGNSYPFGRFFRYANSFSSFPVIRKFRVGLEGLLGLRAMKRMTERRVIEILQEIEESVGQEEQSESESSESEPASSSEFRFLGSKVRFVHRFGERGTFVIFQSLEARERALEGILDMTTGEVEEEERESEERGRTKEKKKKTNPPIRFDAFPVYGSPFVEDILTKHISPKLLIKNDPKVPPSSSGSSLGVLSEEVLFEAFRPFGRLLRIVTLEEGKKYELHFLSKLAAVNARNCMHRSTLTTSEERNEEFHMTVRFVRYHRWRAIFEMLKSPRMIPILVVLATVVVVMLIDPFRMFNTLRRLSSAKKYKTDDDDDLLLGDMLAKMKEVLWGDRQRWGTDRGGVNSAPMIVLLTGKEGSGKSMLMRQLLHGKRFCCILDCGDGSNGVEGAGDDSSDTSVRRMRSMMRSTKEKHRGGVVGSIESSLNFKPSFRTLNRILRYIESLFPGSKSLTFENSDAAISAERKLQLQRIFRILGVTLRVNTVALRNELPVLVFDDLDRISDRNLLRLIVSWSERMTLEGRARIVLVCRTDFHELTMKREFPAVCGAMRKVAMSSSSSSAEGNDVDRSIRVILRRIGRRRGATNFGLPPSSSSGKKVRFGTVLRSYLSRSLFLNRNSQDTVDDSDLDAILSEEELVSYRRIVEFLASRNDDSLQPHLATLYQFADRVAASPPGVPLDDVLQSFVRDTSTQLIQTVFGDRIMVEEIASEERPWSKIGAWHLMNEIAFSPSGSVEYDHAVLDIFRGNACQLQKLMEAGVVCLNEKREVEAFSPLLHQGFLSLITHPTFPAKMKAFEERVQLLAELQMRKDYGTGSFCTLM